MGRNAPFGKLRGENAPEFILSIEKCHNRVLASERPNEALTATGAPRSMVLAKGYWPQVEPAFWSVALLRWDINIRESAVLGLVGAGGIGIELKVAMDLFSYDEAATIILAIFALVLVVERASAWLRGRML